MSRTALPHRLTALFVLLGLVAAACGGGGDADEQAEAPPPSEQGESGSSSEDDASEAGADTGQYPSATPIAEEGEYDPDAIFRWMYSVDAENFDPTKISGVTPQMFLFPIYDTLTYVNPDVEVEPLLSDEWEILENGTILEMSLIEDWDFHDGEPFNATAVKANIERNQQEGAFAAPLLTSLTEIEVVDEYTVRLHTPDGSAATLLPTLSGAAGMMMSPLAFDNPGQDIAPIGGSGAFEMTNYVPGSVVEYTAVEDYWDPDASRVAGMEFMISGNDVARVNAVATGETDVTFLRATTIREAETLLSDDLIILTKPTTATYHFGMNTARSEFGNLKVRQAVNHALDREAINELLLEGLCTPTAQAMPDFFWASSPDVPSDYYEHDPEKARELLAEAGFPDGFEFDMGIANDGVFPLLGEAVQAQLAEAGLRANIILQESGDNRASFTTEKDIDSAFGSFRGEADPAVTVAAVFLPDSSYNPGGYVSAEVERLAAEGRALTDQAERAEVYHELMKVAAEEAYPLANICTLSTPFFASSKVQGLQLFSDSQRRFRYVSIAADD